MELHRPALLFISGFGSLAIIMALTLYRHQHPLNLYLLFGFVSIYLNSMLIVPRISSIVLNSLKQTSGQKYVFLVFFERYPILFFGDSGHRLFMDSLIRLLPASSLGRVLGLGIRLSKIFFCVRACKSVCVYLLAVFC